MTGAIDPISLIERFERMSPDEREVLLCVWERLEKGRENYGALDLSNDSRDMEQEWFEEAIDGFAYVAMKTVQQRKRRSHGPTR